MFCSVFLIAVAHCAPSISYYTLHAHMYAVCMHTWQGSFIIEDIALSTHLWPHHSILNTSLHTQPGQNYLHCFFSPNSSAALLCFFTYSEFTFSSCEGHVKVIVILLLCVSCKIPNPVCKVCSETPSKLTRALHCTRLQGCFLSLPLSVAVHCIDCASHVYLYF